MQNDSGTFEFGGKTWQYRWINDRGLRVAQCDGGIDRIRDGVCSADWPTDGLVSVLVGRRVELVDARENPGGLEAIYSPFT